MEDTIMKNNLDILESSRFKTIRLSNQLIVGNFSSPHKFTFEDGSVLDAVSNYDSERLKVIFNETVVQLAKNSTSTQSYQTVSLDFSLTTDVFDEMEVWIKMWKHNDVDIVLCPLPMIQALHNEAVSLDSSVLNGPFRSVRMKDRIKKTSSIDTFCISSTSFRTLV